MSCHSKHVFGVLAAAVLLAIPVLATAQNTPQLTITDGPRIEYVGPDKAEIAWTTSIGASTIVRYGTDPNHLDQTAESPYARGEAGHHVTHRVKIHNLKPNTTYYFMVDSGQGQGTGTEVKSQVQSFTTKAPRK